MNTEAAKQLIYAVKAVPQWQRQAEARLARNLQRVFDDAAATVIEQMVARGIPVGAPQQAQMLLPLDSAGEQIKDLAADAAVDAARLSRERMAAQLVRMGADVPETLPPLQQAVIDKIREKVFIASETTLQRLRGDVTGLLAQSVEEGLGVRDAANVVADAFEGMRDYEMRRIARTEIHGAVSDEAHRTIQDIGAVYEQWIAASDDRTRDSHVDLNGQIVRTGDAFENGLQYPGDRNGPIEEWINCRCRLVPFVMPRDKQAPTGRAWFYVNELVSKGE